MKLYFAWSIALIGMLISIYFGEVLGLEPCRLCWYQRMALFPLALFLGISTYRQEKRLALYTLPLVFFGLSVAIYQVISASCHSEFCSYVSTLPVLSIFAFAGIGVFILWSFKK